MYFFLAPFLFFNDTVTSVLCFFPNQMFDLNIFYLWYKRPEQFVYIL